MKTHLLTPLSTTAALTLGLAACGDGDKRGTTDTTTADTFVPADTTADDTAEPDTATPDDTATPEDTAPPADTATPDDVTTPGDTATAACSPDNRPACLYAPAATYTFQTVRVDGLTYTDITGATRNVNIAVYRPQQAPVPMPVVLLSHGGASGKDNPLNSMEHWAPVFAEAGYLAIAIAHEGRDETSYTALCTALETNTDHPCSVKVSWDRPHDVAHVLDYLAEQNTSGPLAGNIDLDHVAHVGHSAGAGAALMSLGATRNFKCALPFGFEDPDQNCQVADLVSLAEARIDVALSLSPQGPGSEGFMAESYDTVTKPFMMMTGANDGDPGEPDNRRSIWPLLPTGNKFLLWVEDQGAKHTLFEGSLEACEPIAGANKCRAMRNAIFATGLAFIDAHLRNVPGASAWLASGNLETAGGELFEFERK